MSPSVSRSSEATGHLATPQAAAAFAAVTIVMWAEGILRFWFSKGGDAVLRLWPARAGDIGALWLAISVIGLVAYFVLAAAWRKRTAVGSIPAWTLVVIVSAIVAPLLGEWGQAIGI